MNQGWVYIIASLVGAGLAYLIAGRSERVTMALGIATGVGVSFVITWGARWLLILCALLLMGTVVRGLRTRGAVGTTR